MGILTLRINLAIQWIGALFRRVPLCVNEDCPQVIDVGAGGTGGEEIVEPLKKTSRVILGEKTGSIEAEGTSAHERSLVDKRTRRVVRPADAAVGSIGVAGQRADAQRPLQRDRKRKGIFLVRPAAVSYTHLTLPTILRV